jgi:hypothetical protein|tara:strand:- start:3300 stop:3635 length:336 start_codon:yes stop_codon:yes gene_type:complete
MRYKNQRIFLNEEEAYERYLKKSRGMQNIRQFSTPKMFYPSDLQAAEFRTIKRIWSAGDHYFKLADEYYDNPEMWWVIAFYNQKPTEFDVKPGDVIYIPVPLEAILYNIGY